MITSIEATLLTISLLSVPITLLHSTKKWRLDPRTGSELLSFSRQVGNRMLHPPDLCRLKHPLPRISPGALLRVALYLY